MNTRSEFLRIVPFFYRWFAHFYEQFAHLPHDAALYLSSLWLCRYWLGDSPVYSLNFLEK